MCNMMIRTVLSLQSQTILVFALSFLSAHPYIPLDPYRDMKCVYILFRLPSGDVSQPDAYRSEMSSGHQT